MEGRSVKEQAKEKCNKKEHDKGTEQNQHKRKK